MTCPVCGHIMEEDVQTREALKWYMERAQTISKYLESKKTTGLVAVMTELGLDKGDRAWHALTDKRKS